jgi:TolB-like protein
MRDVGQREGAVQAIDQIEGTVVSMSPGAISIRLSIQEAEKSTFSFTDRITQKIVNRSYLLESAEAAIQREKATLVDRKNDLCQFRLTKPVSLTPGQKVLVSFPKRTIALVDFEVIRGMDRTMGIVSMESLTTSLVRSERFNIVERRKLAALLQEQKLGISGLMDDRDSSKLGKLLQADLILTGTFADMGGSWNVNLRLINVATGFIITAFEEKATFDEIKPGSVRDGSNSIAMDWSSGWLFGSTRHSDGGEKTTRFAENEGVSGHNTCARVDFRIGERIDALLQNLKKRDWTFYSGIEFYAKSDKPLTIAFYIMDENRDNFLKHDMWMIRIPIDTSWQKYRINFKDLYLNPLHMEPGADQVLSLDLISLLGFKTSVATKRNITGTFWIDDVKLF